MFEKIKNNWQKKIEKNAIKSTLTYVDRKGIAYEERVIFKRSLLPLGDWNRIFPPINESGKLNLTNLIFGGWRNLIKLITILVLIGLILMQFKENFAAIEYWKGLAQSCNIGIN